MMVEQICFSDVLIEGAREVFETMMFMAVAECEDDAEIMGDAFLSTITFSGKLEGVLGVSCDEESTKSIAVNMLGLDPDDQLSDEELADAMGEVANMVLGSVKKGFIDVTGDVQVSIPCVVKGKQLESSIGGNSHEIDKYIYVDECVMKLSLIYKEND